MLAWAWAECRAQHTSYDLPLSPADALSVYCSYQELDTVEVCALYQVVGYRSTNCEVKASVSGLQCSILPRRHGFQVTKPRESNGSLSSSRAQALLAASCFSSNSSVEQA